jgi:transposase
MASWMIKCGELVQPLINLLNEDLLVKDYLQMDETRVQVLKEKGKTAESLSYMWVRAHPGTNPIVLFDYDPTRSGAVPVKLLEGFKGHLQVDGYAGYNEVTEKPFVTRGGCFAHSRRKFFEAKEASKKAGIANKGVAYIKKFYKVEDECRHMSPIDRFNYRNEHARPIVAEMREWLDTVLPTVPPKTIVGKALLYAHNEWPCLVRYLDDGRYEIDNNFVENQIRPFALGRKNWLFSDSVDGAMASSNLFSLIVTAKANHIEPYGYLKHIFEKLPTARTVTDLEALLPSAVKKILPH